MGLTIKQGVVAVMAGLVMSTISQADEATARSSGCLGCHQVANKTVGPAIKDIAAKYSAADVDALVAVVKAGRGPGDLTWGAIPMPASPAPEGDIKTVITWMLQQ